MEIKHSSGGREHLGSVESPEGCQKRDDLTESLPQVHWIEIGEERLAVE